MRKSSKWVWNGVRHWLVARSKRIPDGLRSVGNMLNAALESKGMNQRDLAAQLNVSEARVSQILNGEANLTVKTLIKVAAILKMDLQIGLTESNKT